MNQDDTQTPRQTTYCVLSLKDTKRALSRRRHSGHIQLQQKHLQHGGSCSERRSSLTFHPSGDVYILPPCSVSSLNPPHLNNIYILLVMTWKTWCWMDRSDLTNSQFSLFTKTLRPKMRRLNGAIYPEWRHFNSFFF